MLRGLGEGLVNRKRLLEHRHRLVAPGTLELLLACRPLARRRAEPIDTQAAGELPEPGPDGRVVTEPIEVFVGTRKDLLEDVLGVRLRQAKGLDRDRVDIAREALDEIRPNLLVTGPASRDKLAIAERRRHRQDCDW